PAHAHLRTAVTDEHLALHHARSTGDGVAPCRIDSELLPDRLAGRGIERDETAVERSEIHLAVPRSDAAVRHVAAGVHAPLAGNFGVVAPELLARARIERKDLAPRGGYVHHAVDDERGGFLNARLGVEIMVPGELQLPDVPGVDLRERAEALLVVSAPIRHPVGAVGTGRDEPRRIDRGPGRSRPGGRGLLAPAACAKRKHAAENHHHARWTHD